jgi:hypothetical protein
LIKLGKLLKLEMSASKSVLKPINCNSFNHKT